MATKKKTAVQVAAERLQAQAVDVFEGHSDLVAIEVHIVGHFIDEEGGIAGVDLGTLQAAPRRFKPNKEGLFSRGFYLNGKVNDPTLTGQASGTRLQVGCNLIVIGSKAW